MRALRAQALAALPRRLLPSALLLTLGATLCAPAHAYLGPGAGLGVFGTLFGIGAAIVLALFGLLWYPLKRAFGKKAPVPVADETRMAADLERPDTTDTKG